MAPGVMAYARAGKPFRVTVTASIEPIKSCSSLPSVLFLSFEWNSIRLGGPAHGILTKTVHKTLPGGGGGQVGKGGRVGGWWESKG